MDLGPRQDPSMHQKRCLNEEYLCIVTHPERAKRQLAMARITLLLEADNKLTC